MSAARLVLGIETSCDDTSVAVQRPIVPVKSIVGAGGNTRATASPLAVNGNQLSGSGVGERMWRRAIL